MRRINSALVTAAKNSDYEGVQVSTDTVDSWDGGYSASIVFIDEVKDKDQYYQTTLLRELSSFAGTNNGPSIQSLNANGVAITVKSNSGNQAAIEVSTEFALPCAQGFVWREASAIDRVCLPFPAQKPILHKNLSGLRIGLAMKIATDDI